MLNQSALVRETLRYADSFRGAGICIAPSGLGTIDRDDLEMLMRQDVDLLVRLGIDIALIDYRDDRSLWKDMVLPSGMPFFTAADDSDVVRIASERKARKLCLAAATDRIAGTNGPLDDVPLPEAERLLGEKKLTRQCRQVLSLSVAACKAGVPRVHVFNAHRTGTLLQELFTNSGAGTMVYSGETHKEVRPTVPEDFFSVCELMHTSVRRKTVSFVRDCARDVRVFVVDGVVHGVARITHSGDVLVVRSLHHSNHFNVADVLEHLLKAALDEAKRLGVHSVAVLVSEIPARMRIQPWFTRLGFVKRVISNNTNVSGYEAWQKEVA